MISTRQAPNWDTALERIAKVTHNAHMADEWDELPPHGIERAIWIQVAAAVVKEIQIMMDERKNDD